MDLYSPRNAQKVVCQKQETLASIIILKFTFFNMISMTSNHYVVFGNFSGIFNKFLLLIEIRYTAICFFNVWGNISEAWNPEKNFCLATSHQVGRSLNSKANECSLTLMDVERDVSGTNYVNFKRLEIKSWRRDFWRKKNTHSNRSWMKEMNERSKKWLMQGFSRWKA